MQKPRYRKAIREYNRVIARLKAQKKPYDDALEKYEKKKKVPDINQLIQHRR